MKFTLVRRTPRTHDTESFYFKPEQPLAFTAGQYLYWEIPHESADDRGPKRWFSICSAPSDPDIMFTTKFSDPSSTFKAALKKLQPGAVLEATGPEGDFVLPEDETKGVVLVAGGVGVTPFHSMLAEMAARGSSRPVHLIYAVRTPADLLFGDEIDQWATAHPNLQVTYVVGQPDEHWTGKVGQLSSDLILELAGDLGNRLLYISGPEPMVEKFETELGEKVPKEQLKFDYFPNYTPDY